MENKGNDMTEENVVQHIKRRNEKALAFVVRTYGGLLAAIIKRHVQHDRHAYEECLDDVLLAVWDHIDAFDETRTTFKQWTAAIAKYRAIDYQRRMIRSRQQYVPSEITDDLYQRQQQGQPGRQAEAVADMLSHLTDVERAIFEQYYLEGVPSRELAKRMNVKESWIHNKLSRGRRKLKNLLTPENEV